MVLSTQTEVGSNRLGDEKCVRMICEAGFDALDYSMFCMQADDNILNQPAYLEHVIKVKKSLKATVNTLIRLMHLFRALRSGRIHTTR